MAWSRREFVVAGAAAGGGLLLSCRLGRRNEPVAAGTFAPNAWIRISREGTVTLVVSQVEMGQGTYTAMPMLLAEELDVDMEQVTVEAAPPGAAYFNPATGFQATGGSTSVRAMWTPLRRAGATARAMLVAAAAKEWGIDASSCRVERGTIYCDASGRMLSYGQLADKAATMTVPEKVTLKDSKQWNLIGTSAKRLDSPGKVNGSAKFGIDTVLPGMRFAAVVASPVFGGTLASVDDRKAMAVKGVSQVVHLDNAVAVIADNTWSAFKGRNQLKIEWDNGAHAVYNSESYKKELQETAKQPGKVVHSIGDADAEFGKGGKILEAEYYAPHLAHASMEPPVAVADVRSDKVTVWSPTQNPQGVQEEVAKKLGIKKEDVTCHVTFLGGGFGRKSKPDYAVEAAVLSKKTGKPVKVVWSREDDIKFDYFHSVAAMYIKAAVDDKGMPKAWLQRSVFPSISSTFDKDAVYGSDGEMSLGWNVIPFDVPNFRSENGKAVNHVRIGWLRSVANIYHAFAVQSFANELAYAAGRDPYDYLLALIGSGKVIEAKQSPEVAAKYPYDTARLRHVAELAAQKANWGKKKSGNGWGMGIAVHRSFLTYVATVVEAEVDSDGVVRIPNVYTAIDAGIVANPDMVRSQFQGAAVFGTSIARTGQITATNGVIDQSNFHDYQVARMNDAPVHVDVQIVESTAPPAGVGEPGVPPFVPALCNAIYAASGKRVRELPLIKNGLA